MMMPVDWAVVMPSLVYGPGGASARLFDTLASLPLIPSRPADRSASSPCTSPTSPARCCASSNLRWNCAARCSWSARSRRPSPISCVRCGQRWACDRRTVCSVPRPLIAAVARLGDHLPGAFLSRETLGMLERGNVGDSGAFTRLLGRPPLPVSAFVNPTGRQQHAGKPCPAGLRRCCV